jgi:hypothetical protein
MSDGTTIIQSALKLIGKHSIVQPADPESVEIGKFTLNSMLQLWLSQNVDMGIVPLNAEGDELGEPLDARQGIINNLAILMAPNFDNGDVVVSQTLMANARLSKAEIKRLYRSITIPNKVVSSTLPKGAGNQVQSNYWTDTYFVKGSTLDSSNS